MVNVDDNIQNAARYQTVTVAEEINTIEQNGQKVSGEVCEVVESHSGRVGEEMDDGSDDDNNSSASDSSSTVDSRSWQTINMGRFREADAMLTRGCTPKQVIEHLFPDVGFDISRFDNRRLFGLLAELLDRPVSREKLTQYNTLSDAIELFRTKKKILVLTGAGVSVSCGIPDFRSKDGIYARLHKDFPDLPEPSAMFDIRYFRSNPAPFYDFAKELFPGQFTPSVSHRFIKLLEDNNQLLRNYTQNIDTLEYQTGITRVVECHGSFSKATCLQCGEKYEGNAIKDDVMNKRVAMCRVCQVGVIKPDIVFFGEDLGKHFHRQVVLDKDEVDLVVVIGSSLKVRPVSLIPHSVGKDVPQILINRESLTNSGYCPDIELLGNCDDVIREICFTLGGKFAAMIQQFDREVKKSIQQAVNRRRFIAIDEFKTIIHGNEFECPPAKKPRRAEDITDDLPNVSNVIEKRVISIVTKLPEMSCAQISSHQTIFPGAEAKYDLETRSITCKRNRICVEPSIISDDDDDDTSLFDGKLERTLSVDRLDFDEQQTETGLSNGVAAVDLDNSCPSFLEYEESTKIGPTDFREACQDLLEEEEK